jgi:hypothetical protein
LEVAWYRGFMHFYSSKITRKSLNIRDTKRNTRVRKEHLENIYQCVYKMMVEAGVAEELAEEIQYGN